MTNNHDSNTFDFSNGIFPVHKIMKIVLWHRHTWKKKFRVLPTGVEPKTFRLLVRMLCHWATGDSWELRPLNQVRVTNILHTARIWMSMSGICGNVRRNVMVHVKPGETLIYSPGLTYIITFLPFLPKYCLISLQIVYCQNVTHGIHPNFIRVIHKFH